MTTDQRFDLLSRLAPFDIGQCVVANLGAGYCASPISSQFSQLRCRKLINVEVFTPYYDKLTRVRFLSPVENVHMDILEWMDRLNGDTPLDVVIMLDVIEHFEKSAAQALINHLLEVVHKGIVMFIPFGPCPQDDLDDNHFQRHLSTWAPEDFVPWNTQMEVFHDFHTHVSPPADAAWVTVRPTIQVA